MNQVLLVLVVMVRGVDQKDIRGLDVNLLKPPFQHLFPEIMDGVLLI